MKVVHRTPKITNKVSRVAHFLFSVDMRDSLFEQDGVDDGEAFGKKSANNYKTDKTTS